ncbi:cytochrome P450 4C1-like [Adelges cooleyi]|uniref:cytochrome P450 4C1-like n=1 Tax=Adelges cooleyi TaxID=133065 RepID=UPI00217F624B|nr:cytochrome P450 4C1-like [Adelges cooleyi]
MNWLNIFSGALASVSNISIIIWLLLIILLTCRFYKMYYDERAIERRKQISLLPSLTKTYLETINFIWLVSSMSPQDTLPYFSSVLKSVGPLVYMNTIIRDYVFINDPDDIKILLSSTQHITKGPEYSILEPWLSTGLLTSTDEKWQTRRKLLTNTFHFKILETYIPAFNKHANGLVQNLAKASKNDQLVTNIDSHVTLCALDIVCETIMGVSLRSQEGQSIEYVKAIKTMSRVVKKRIITGWLWSDTIFNVSTWGRQFYKSLKVLHEFSKNVIQQRKQKLNFSENPIAGTIGERKKVQSFLDLLIEISKEHPNSMTDADVQEEVDTFLFEGHDTSSIAMTMALIHIGMNQNIQDNIREELQGIFGDSDRDATMEDLKSMFILERVIKETMRLYPSVPSVTRTLNQPLQLKNHTIPAHSIIGVLIYILHRDESMYPNPEVFDADRFLPEQCNDRHPYGYLPFSAGPRNCIGQKFAMYLMKTVLSTVVRHMKLETLGTQKDIVVSTQLVLKADSLPSLKLTPLFENHKK